ncbi:DUF4276 family protein [Pseudomonas denitrificans (nom. rej.)]|uniref:DUF4276 family protein n=1 Tax=Pseudomonas denitrificans TaxID=43306 RepID=A0A9X7R365_PSEDE|nr:DUF4276 family protein [Pseudomonas denitrificans (nom. rej.)]QEY70958.1 hypothetical protein F1C79_04480 [Pseudomonas denitrificans (nom. rej.)]
MKINFILTGEGTSDLRLVDHIETILINEGFSEVSGEAPDLRLFEPPIGNSVRDKLVTLARNYPSADVFFVHRDADGAGLIAREREILDSAQNIISADKVIPVIPVTMLETWLLADTQALKRVAGNQSFRGNIEPLSRHRNLETIANSKQVLLEALCLISETEGARLRKFKNRFQDMRARLTYDLDPEGPVNNLDSYRNFRTLIRNFSQSKLATE